MKQNSSLEKAISEWLKNQGYPLEIYTARAFQKAGFYTRLSDIYTDFETEQHREIDVTAQRNSPVNHLVQIQISCHIECKSSQEKPWILFVSETSTNEVGFLFEYLISSEKLNLFLAKNLTKESQKEIKGNISSIPYPMSKNIGYGLAQAFTSGQDVPYKAVMSAIKSSISRSLNIGNITLSNNLKKYLFHSVAFPVIVVGGKLFECTLDEKENPNLKEVEKGTLLTKYPNPTQSTPFVTITTKKALFDVANDFRRISDTIIDLGKSREIEISNL